MTYPRPIVLLHLVQILLHDSKLPPLWHTGEQCLRLEQFRPEQREPDIALGVRQPEVARDDLG